MVNKVSKKKKVWPEGIKRTKQRESVLSILESALEPLSAAEISSKMEEEGEKVWMSTVYRALEVFVKNDLVIKTNVLNSEMAVYELNRFEHKHYAVCISCHKLISMDNCPMDKFIPELQDEDFKVLGHNLEIFGYCKDCMTP